jgi:hypothetical protein
MDGKQLRAQAGLPQETPGFQGRRPEGKMGEAQEMPTEDAMEMKASAPTQDHESELNALFFTRFKLLLSIGFPAWSSSGVWALCGGFLAHCGYAGLLLLCVNLSADLFGLLTAPNGVTNDEFYSKVFFFYVVGVRH